MIKDYTEIKHFIKCNIDDKIFTDIDNKSGILSKHLKTILNDYDEKKLYSYYTKFSKKEVIKTLKCPCCDYTTKDHTNKSGVFTQHIKHKHNLPIDDFCEKYPDYKSLWKMYFIRKDRKDFINSSKDNAIECKVCKKYFKKLTQTHLENHGLTPTQYKEKYNITNTCSKTTTNKQKKLSFELQIDKVFSRIESYGVIPLFTKDDFKGVNIDNKYKFKCSTCQNIFEDHLDDGNDVICRICNPKLKFAPNKKLENEIYSFLKDDLSITDLLTNDRKVLKPKEIDLYIPHKNTAIEVNGLYWHSEHFKEKSYHIDKTLQLREKNIRCIHIFEDEWYDKQEILKSKISHILGENRKEKIYARKCNIKEISSSEKSIFLKNNHIQGNDKSFYNIGAYYDDKLVAIMTFCKPRMIMGYKSSDEFIELSRFCTDINYNVIGIGNKLFTYLKNNYTFKKCITYADIRFTDLDANIYTMMGFNKISVTSPNYFWCNNRKRHYRYTFNKQKLIKDGYDKNKTEVEIMHERKYYRIWDCGHIKYEYTNNK